jgi:hypothetical protein
VEVQVLSSAPKESIRYEKEAASDGGVFVVG